MTTLGHRIWPEKSHTYLKSSLPEEAVQVKVLDAENSDQVLAAEDAPEDTPEEAVQV
jgi:hypothetical protein